MKPHLLAVLSAFACSAAFAADAGNNTATISFSGRITDQACVFDSSSTSVAVQLGVYPTSYFTSKSTTTEAKPFELKISDCKITTKDDGENLPADRVRLTFTDMNYIGGTQSNGLLVNGAVGNAAKNIGILINYQSKTDTEAKTPLFDETSSGTQQITLDKFAYTTEAGDNSQGAMLRFKAAMKRTSDAAPTTGRVEGLMTVRLETF